MEKSNTVEGPTVVPATELPGSVNEKQEPTTPPSHLKDKDEINAYNAVPEYTGDAESQELKIHLDTAADIVTQVIDLEDEPDLNPWTFRMFFIGKHYFPLAVRFGVFSV